MRKITTLTIAILLSIFTSWAQQILPVINTATDSPNASTNSKNLINANKSMGNNVYSQDFNTVGTGINGVPSDWTVINSSGSVLEDQWRWLDYKGNPVPTIGLTYNNNEPKNEILISPAITVPATNPTMQVDISASYYWYVDENTDDAQMFISNDGGSNWTQIWKDDDQTQVEACGMPWPYTSFAWYTASFDLAAYVGQDVMFKFYVHNIATSGIMGVSFYIDNFKVGSLPDNDLVILDNTICSYDDINNNYYSYNLNTQMPNDTTFQNVFVKNIGMDTQTGVNLDFRIKKNGTTVLSQNINAFSQGGNTLLPNQTDTFIFYNIFEYDNNAEYTFSYTVLQTQAEQDNSDNIFELKTIINDSRVSRYNEVNGKIGLGSYTNTVSGDKLGIYVELENPGEEFLFIGAYIMDDTEVGDIITPYVMEPDGTEIYGNAYTIQAQDIGEYITLPLGTFTTVPLPVGWYRFGFDFSNLTTMIGVESTPYSGYKTFLTVGGDIYHMGNTLPAIDIYTEECGFDGVINKTLCDGSSYTSPSGDYTWSADGTYHDTVTNLFGCDSIYTINLIFTNDITITDQSTTQHSCYGVNTTLFVDVVASNPTYQWYKDGNTISGATDATYTIVNSDFTDEGDYNCIINNDCGATPVVSSTITIDVLQINLNAGTDDYFCLGSSYQLNATMSPNYTGGFYSKTWSPATTLSATNILNPVATPTETTGYTITISDDINGCTEQGTITLTMIETYQTQQICMVTVDTLTGENLVVWEPTQNENIAEYIVYRESFVSGIYDVLGAVSASNLTVFTDATADPMSQPYKYKVTIRDACDNLSEIDSCYYHKTIHLQTSLGSPNGYNLEWTEYEGFPYSTYNIYGRETGIGSFTLVHQSANGINSWTDGTTVPSMEYRIAVEKAVPCLSNKVTGGPYSHSLSNLDDYSIGTSVNNFEQTGIYLYPNPSTGIFTIRGEDITKITITDLNGKTILVIKDITEFNNIDLSKQAKGIYMVKILKNDNIIMQKVVIE